MAVYYRSDMAEIHVTVTGVATDLESWDVMEGGDPVAEEATVFPGGMQPQIALGGIPKWSAVTVERFWSESLIKIYKSLVAGVGNAPAQVSYIQKNNSKTARGKS